MEEAGGGEAAGQRAGRVVGDYILGPMIGSGSFAVVWRARHRRHGREAAVKEIDKKRVSRKVGEGLLKEITILRNICHPNVVRLYQVVQTEDRLFLVLEYCAGGDLAAYMKRHGCQGRVSDGVARHFMRQIAEGLKVLRENNLIHRDLKPQNLLLSTDDEMPVLKIGDFGFARYLMPQRLADTLCGSPLYMAPEIFQHRRYDAKADLWSVGAILFELVTGKLPFGGNTQFQLFQNIMSSGELRFPQDLLVHIHPDCISLCRSLLRRNPVERIGFEGFFTHNFITTPSTSGTYVESENTPDATLNRDNQPTSSSARRSGVGEQVLSSPNALNVVDSLEYVEREYVIVRAHCSSIGTFSSSSGASFLDNSKTRSVSYSLKNVKGNRGVIQSTSPAVSPAYAGVGSCLSSHSCVPEAPISPEDITRALTSNSASQASTTLDDVACASSLHPSSRIQLLDHYIKAITDVVHEKLLVCCRYKVSNEVAFKSSSERGLLLESFSLELLILAVWTEAIKVSNAWMASHDDGDTLAGSSDDQSHKGDSLCLKSTDKLDCTTPLSACSWAEKGFISDCDRAEDIHSRLKEMDGDMGMPDAFEILYQTALAAGKSGAVDELMGYWSRAIASYSKAITFLSFIVFEAISLGLNPPFSLSLTKQRQLRTYIAALRARLKVLNDQQPTLPRTQVDCE